MNRQRVTARTYTLGAYVTGLGIGMLFAVSLIELDMSTAVRDWPRAVGGISETERRVNRFRLGEDEPEPESESA